MNNEHFQYEPGVCNIDITGIQWRKKLGTICLITGIVSLTAMYYVHFEEVYRSIVGAGFGYMTALNFIQAKEHFCVFNASRRTFETFLKKTKITNDLGKDKDFKKMRSVIGKSLLFALIGALAGLLPL
jgi:hypothetical protein